MSYQPDQGAHFPGASAPLAATGGVPPPPRAGLNTMMPPLTHAHGFSGGMNNQELLGLLHDQQVLGPRELHFGEPNLQPSAGPSGAVNAHRIPEAFYAEDFVALDMLSTKLLVSGVASPSPDQTLGGGSLSSNSASLSDRNAVIPRLSQPARYYSGNVAHLDRVVAPNPCAPPPPQQINVGFPKAQSTLHTSELEVPQYYTDQLIPPNISRSCIPHQEPGTIPNIARQAWPTQNPPSDLPIGTDPNTNPIKSRFATYTHATAHPTDYAIRCPLPNCKPNLVPLESFPEHLALLHGNQFLMDRSSSEMSFDGASGAVDPEEAVYWVCPLLNIDLHTPQSGGVDTPIGPCHALIPRVPPLDAAGTPFTCSELQVRAMLDHLWGPMHSASAFTKMGLSISWDAYGKWYPTYGTTKEVYPLPTTQCKYCLKVIDTVPFGDLRTDDLMGHVMREHPEYLS
ncbi:hypothetical protein MD484_g8174, partial [Candolleomyces efflorescens]